jgi:hypothetical protein
MSAAPPAASGVTILTCRDGHSCAYVATGITEAAASANNAQNFTADFDKIDRVTSLKA